MLTKLLTEARPDRLNWTEQRNRARLTTSPRRDSSAHDLPGVQIAGVPRVVSWGSIGRASSDGTKNYLTDKEQHHDYRIGTFRTFQEARWKTKGTGKAKKTNYGTN